MKGSAGGRREKLLGATKAQPSRGKLSAKEVFLGSGGGVGWGAGHRAGLVTPQEVRRMEWAFSWSTPGTAPFLVYPITSVCPHAFSAQRPAEI